MNELQKFNQNHELQLPQETKELLATIFEQGTAPNTLKAHQRDVENFWQWAEVSYGVMESYPVTVELIIQFITDHLGGMKPDVDEQLVAMGVKKPGPNKLSTIKRRLYSLSACKNSDPCSFHFIWLEYFSTHRRHWLRTKHQSVFHWVGVPKPEKPKFRRSVHNIL